MLHHNGFSLNAFIFATGSGPGCCDLACLQTPSSMVGIFSGYCAILTRTPDGGTPLRWGKPAPWMLPSHLHSSYSLSELDSMGAVGHRAS